MNTRRLAIALIGTGALALAGCGSMQVPDVVGMNPEQAIEAKPAAEIKPASDKARDRSAAGSGCARQKRAVVVSLSKYPNIAAHVRDAIAAGQPVILHIDRKHADEHRAASTDDLPTKRGYDRDEYPPAMSREGGETASVRHVKSSENRAAGASMGGQLRGYCDGQAFRLKVGQAPKPAEPKPVATATPAPEVAMSRVAAMSPSHMPTVMPRVPPARRR